MDMNNQEKSSTYRVKDFLPLILIITLIILFVLGKQLLECATISSSCFMNDFMGIFFLTFGTIKIIHLRAFAQAYAMYDIIAQRSSLYAHIYPFIEIGLGILYMTRIMPTATNIFTLILMLVSAVGVARALAQKQHITCACLGTVFKVPMTYVTLAEDLVMAGMALSMLLRS